MKVRRVKACWPRASCLANIGTSPFPCSPNSIVYLPVYAQYFELASFLSLTLRLSCCLFHLRHQNHQHSYLRLPRAYLDWDCLVSHSSHASSDAKDRDSITWYQLDYLLPRNQTSTMAFAVQNWGYSAVYALDKHRATNITLHASLRVNERRLYDQHSCQS